MLVTDSERQLERELMMAQFRRMKSMRSDVPPTHPLDPEIIVSPNIADGFWIRDKNIKGVHLQQPLWTVFNSIDQLDGNALFPDLQHVFFNASCFQDSLNYAPEEHAPAMIGMRAYYDYLSAYYNVVTGKKNQPPLVRYSTISGPVSREPQWHPDMSDVTLGSSIHNVGPVYAAGIMNEAQIETLCKDSIVPEHVEVCYPKAGDIVLFKGNDKRQRPLTLCLMHKSSDCLERVSLVMSD